MSAKKTTTNRSELAVLLTDEDCTRFVASVDAWLAAHGDEAVKSGDPVRELFERAALEQIVLTMVNAKTVEDACDRIAYILAVLRGDWQNEIAMCLESDLCAIGARHRETAVGGVRS